MTALSDALQAAQQRDKDIVALCDGVRALAAALEQAERERDERILVSTADEWLAHRFNQTWDALQAAEARLAEARKALEAADVLRQGPLRLILEQYSEDHPDDHMAVWNVNAQMAELVGALPAALAATEGDGDAG